LGGFVSEPVVEERIRVYLEDARKFVEEAIKEFKGGVKENNMVRIRDSAEKAWNATIQAANVLILKYVNKVPSSHWERRRLLRQVEEKFSEIEKLGLRDRYSARERNLHELVFYEGIIEVEDIDVELKKAEKFVEDIEKVTRKVEK
jgi:uncharacterized protein (UPF0332 family)